MATVNKWLLPVLLLVLIFLLFVGGPEHYSSRIYRNIWDLGHIVLFIVFSIFLFRLSFIERERLFIQLVVVFIIVIFFAVLTELLQLGAKRTPELIDVRRDIVGALIGSLIVFKKNRPRCKVFLVLACIVFFLTIYEFKSLAMTLVDEYYIYKTGAVISNLEGPFEDERWKGNSQYYLSDEFVIEGKKSLKVIFNTDEYSGITLKYMYRDWSVYNSLHFSIYYHEENDLLLNVRINDFLHIKNNRYNDRFNKEIILTNGWNYFNFSIHDIENAPEERKSNLKNMQSLGIFVTNVSKPETIYIDNVYLN